MTFAVWVILFLLILPDYKNVLIWTSDFNFSVWLYPNNENYLISFFSHVYEYNGVRKNYKLRRALVDLSKKNVFKWLLQRSVVRNMIHKYQVQFIYIQKKQKKCLITTLKTNILLYIIMNVFNLSRLIFCEHQHKRFSDQK